MSRRNRWLLLARLPLVCAALAACVAPGIARAQVAPKADPSPFAPGDMKRPIFDTQTPVYNTADVQAKTAATVVAEVDGRAVTLADARDAIGELPPSVKDSSFADLFPGVLDKLVRVQALVIRAQHQALDEDPAVRRKIKAVSDQVLADALLEREGSRSITEAALLERYKKDVAGQPGPEEVHVRVIMVPTEQEAMNIIGELRGGADFATLAKRSSTDATAPAGGDVGFVVREGLTPEVGAVVFSMQPGQFTPFPVRSVGSWFVLKVEERRRQATPAFSVAREGLRQAMLREGVVGVVKAAMADVTVREFDFTGKETDASAANGGARASH
ncbi:MAG: peptidylprolyl isomerase [Rhodopila sp.]|nr:peptidylprolyl isomerase [Rhodopila sp.]